MMTQLDSDANVNSDDPLQRPIMHVSEAVGSFIDYWGFKAIYGRVWTLLALHHQPLTQVAIAEKLNVSRSLVSGVMNDLTGFGLVRPVSDHRNAPYDAVLDIWPIISDVLRNREWMLLESARTALESAIEEATLRADDSGMDYNVDRMRLLLTMTELAQALLKVIISVRVPNSLEGLGPWFGRANTFLRAFRS